MSILLKNGLIVDGSGSQGSVGDLLIEGDKIIACGKCGNVKAKEVIDCEGKIIAPGFVDVHTHDDAMVLTSPQMRPKISQGITTVIVGNCGISLVPHLTQKPMPPLNLLGRSHFCFESIKRYEAAVHAASPSVNVAALIGHTSLRASVMSEFDRSAYPEEQKKMNAFLKEAMEEGALGLSSGVFYTPAFDANEAELIELATIAAAYGGVYTTHIRNEMDGLLEAMQEAADIAKQAAIPLIFSHHKCAKRSLWGKTKESLALIDRLSTHQPIGLDVYPYTAGSTVLREDLVDGKIDVLLTFSEKYPDMAGRLLSDIAQEWGCTEQEACSRLQPGGACYFQMDENDVKRVLSHPKTMIGSDGLPHDVHPHPRLWGTFPRVLGHYCRDLGLFPIEAIISRMTALPAVQFGLAARGMIKEGYFADVVVFDPLRIEDQATFQHPKMPSQGLSYVFVNGALAYGETKRAQEERRGRFLRKGS